jgi:hypothetical protein
MLFDSSLCQVFPELIFSKTHVGTKSDCGLISERFFSLEHNRLSADC